MTGIRRFKLQREFLDKFTEMEPKWGYLDDAGNSLGEIIFLRTYSRLKDDGTKETWQETCQRVIEGMFTVQREHCRRNKLPWDYKKAQRTAQDAYQRMFEFKWLPPGRGIANMGASFVVDEWDGTALQNCAFVSTKTDFAEAMHFLMLASMNGVGVGLDVLGEGRHLVKGTEGDPVEHVIPDTREGWAEALRTLIENHLTGGPRPVFDYSLIRPAGALIRRFGGTASGPEELEKLLVWIQNLMEERKGTHLTITDIADIANKVGHCVVSGSSRRSAEILLGPQEDEYLDLKDFEKSAYRMSWAYMSNNSVYAENGQDYHAVAERTRINGEPGFVWMDETRRFGRMKDRADNRDMRAAGYNPCGEQPLESYEMCTLVESFPSRHDSIEDYLKTVKVAYLYGKTVTLLPTVFERTNAVVARNRRIGLGQSGITTYIDHHGMAQWRRLADAAYREVQRLDNTYSEWLCIRPSIRTTTVKPSGTTSLLTGDSPGVHWNPAAKWYIRRVTMAKGVLADAMAEAGYHVEPSLNSPSSQVVVSFPVASPFKRSERDVALWEKVALAAEVQHWWSDNSVSCTASYFADTEGQHIEPILSLYEGRLKSISFLPMGDASGFAQLPYENISEEQYKQMMSKVRPVNRKHLYSGGQDAEGEKFCTTDSCEVRAQELNQEPADEGLKNLFE